MRTAKRAPRTVDDYLAALPADQRAALKKMRRTIKAAAPDATEYIGYGLAGFKLDGKPLVYLGAMAEHCGLYGPAVVPFIGQIKGYRTTKGSVQFTPDKPLPAAFVTKVVKARTAAIRAK